MITPRIVLVLFIANCFLFVPQTIFGQTERLDIMEYTPPKGWVKTAREGAVVFSNLNQTTNTYCVLSIYPITSSTGEPQQDFVNAWSNLVVKPFNAQANPETDTQSDPDGWLGTAGWAEIEIRGVKSHAILAVISGFGKTARVLSIGNEQSCVTQLDTFVRSIKIDKNEASADSRPPIEIPDPSLDRPGYAPQKPLSGTLKGSITMADLVGTWDTGEVNVDAYVDDKYVDQYSFAYHRVNSLISGESYSISPDGTFQYKFLGRYNNGTLRESDSGNVSLSDTYITFKFKERVTKNGKHQIFAFMTRPDGTAILSLSGLFHDKFQGYDAASMRMRCRYSKGYISCDGGEEWVRRSAKPVK